MDLASSCSQIRVYIEAIGTRTRSKVKVSSCGPTSVTTKDNGKAVNYTGPAATNGPTEEYTREVMSMTRNMVTELTHGRTVRSTQVNGKTANSMERDCSLMEKANQSFACGRMVKRNKCSKILELH